MSENKLADKEEDLVKREERLITEADDIASLFIMLGIFLLGFLILLTGFYLDMPEYEIGLMLSPITVGMLIYLLWQARSKACCK